MRNEIGGSYLVNMFRELSIEFKGIKGAIKDYTSEPCITNYLEELEKSILSKNRDDIVFLLYTWRKSFTIEDIAAQQ